MAWKPSIEIPDPLKNPQLLLDYVSCDCHESRALDLLLFLDLYYYCATVPVQTQCPDNNMVAETEGDKGHDKSMCSLPAT